ncbi:hypothetical protein QCA50_000617 [Cerrena zonata]|uniref:Uncharacterized protein n=1 Tax=Cerrena zonata TaxID=2478898 RepID=A0AAW0GTH4_9APHY
MTCEPNLRSSISKVYPCFPSICAHSIGRCQPYHRCYYNRILVIDLRLDRLRSICADRPIKKNVGISAGG